jgi:hypothetical protein
VQAHFVVFIFDELLNWKSQFVIPERTEKSTSYKLVGIAKRVTTLFRVSSE